MENLDNNIKNQEVEKKVNKKRKCIGICLIAFFCVVVLVVIGLFIIFNSVYSISWNDMACTVNEIYQELTDTDNKLLPEFYEDYADAKPVIYLYPEKEIDIEVKLENVDFTATYPEYKNGWVVRAIPNGSLIDSNNREYNYLYWEGYSDYNSDISKGFIVAKEDYISFFEEKLEYVGLSDREVCDFISYWLPICNQYDYMLISFQKDYGENVKIDYSIKPDNELVVFVAFKGLDKPIDIEEQDLSSYKEFKREGFVAVEWGGEIIK